jgi:hypothetical protein
MKAQAKREKDGSLTITLNFKPEGNMFEQESQILEATNLAGRIAMKESLESFDTDGKPIVVDNELLTSKGIQKKKSKPSLAKLK